MKPLVYIAAAVVMLLRSGAQQAQAVVPVVMVTRSMAATVPGTKPFAPYFINDPRKVSFPPGTAVVLDLETRIPHPVRAERRFVARAHAKGYVAWLAPSPDAASTWSDFLKLAAVESDGYLAQVQSWQCDRAEWLRRIAQINAVHPGGPVVAELSAMRPPFWRGGECLVGNSGAQLARDALAYPRIAVWGYPDMSASPYLPGAVEVAIIRDMLKRLGG